MLLHSQLLDQMFDLTTLLEDYREFHDFLKEKDASLDPSNEFLSGHEEAASEGYGLSIAYLFN